MKLPLILIAVLLLLFSWGCEKQSKIEPREYPFVVTREVTQVDSTGATFVAELLDRGKQEIIDYGFVWRDNETQFKYSLFNEQESDHFKLNVSSDLKHDKTYWLYAYTKTRDKLVKGNDVKFTSKGASRPVFQDFHPKSGNSGDTIQLEGKHFSVSQSRNRVSFGEDRAKINAVDFDRIEVILPDRLTKSGQVHIYLTSGPTQLRSKDKFDITGHRVHDFKPDSGIIGETRVRIEGSGFKGTPDSIQVFIGDYEAEVLEVHEQELQIKMPYSIPPGKYSIEVIINHQVATCVGTLKAVSRWSRINPFPDTSRIGGYFTICNNKGYYIGGGTYVNDGKNFPDVWEYSFSTDTWKEKAEFPGIPRYLAAGFTLNSKIYYGTGDSVCSGVSIKDELKDFWVYDPDLDSWEKLSDFPGDARYGAQYFSMNGFGYLAGGKNYENRSTDEELWKYDPNSDSWELVGDIYYDRFHAGLSPFSVDSRLPFFEHNGYGYMIKDKEILYKFDPEYVGYYEKITELPYYKAILHEAQPLFVIDDLLHVGLILNGDKDKTEVWTYNMNTGLWKRIEDFRADINTLVKSFSHNNKGYLGFMTGYSEIPSASIWMYNLNIQ